MAKSKNKNQASRRNKPARRPTVRSAELPTRDDILVFIREADGKVGKREIGRAFGIKGADRVYLKQLLAQMSEEGLLSGNRKGLQEKGRLPNVAIVDIIGLDPGGDLVARPAKWNTKDGPEPRILMLSTTDGDGSGGSDHSGHGDGSGGSDHSDGSSHSDGNSGSRSRATSYGRGATHGRGATIGRGSSLGVGDQVLARLTALKDPDAPPQDDTDPVDGVDTNPDIDMDAEGYDYTARAIKKLPRTNRLLLGIFRSRGTGGVIDPIDRKQLKEWAVPPHNIGKAVDGDLVRFELNKRGRYGQPDARVVEALGNPSDQQQISLIAVHAHGIPDTFPQNVLDELDDLKAPGMAGRTDLRELPLITIDPSDARDHDDAVHASPDPDPANEGGYIVTVAIADVAHYIANGSALDTEALKRGNSCYFPDRVVPMLPEKISNDLCSLREGEERACLAVQMVFDAKGDKRKHKFLRAMMRSAAKLSYQEAQTAIDGKASDKEGGDKSGPLLQPVLEPLWAAYRLVNEARNRRDPLALNLPERKIVLDDAGQVARVIVPERLDAHKLIEEFMIQANVAAAETLEQHKTPLVYRVHDQPSKEKIKALRDFLDGLEDVGGQKLMLPKVTTLRPEHFNGILRSAKDTSSADLVSEIILRSQAQAEYHTDNCGHFGLNLRRYAHFTSPIRRYADLLVHRALIRALELGADRLSPDGHSPDGLSKDQEADLRDIAQAISDTERRAMAAERETTDRLIAAYLSNHIGAEFNARISGVIKSGLFVRLKDTGADGFVPASTLGDEYYQYDERQHALIGEYSARGFKLGDEVEVKLVEAIAMAGALRFEMLSEGKRGHVSLAKGHNRKQRRHPQRGRQSRRRR